MLIKIFLVAALTFSISCFAESAGDKSKLSFDSDQQKQTSPSDSSTTKENSQAPQDSKQTKKPAMVEYCKKNTC